MKNYWTIFFMINPIRTSINFQIFLKKNNKIYKNKIEKVKTKNLKSKTRKQKSLKVIFPRK